MHAVIVILSAMLCNINFASSNSTSYSLEDLEYLYKEKSYLEILDHAKDVLPKERNNRWREIISNSSIGLIEFFIKRKEFSTENFLKIEQLSTWTNLSNDEFFYIRRNSFGQNYFQNCSKSVELCKSQLQKFWNTTPKSFQSEELALNLSKLNISSKNQWEYFKILTRSDFSDIYCTKKNIQTELYFQIKKILQKETELITKKIALQDLANEACFKALDDTFKEQLFSKDYTTHTTAYWVLHFRNKLTQNETDSYFSYYLLSTPTQSHLFNLAWNELKKIGQNFRRKSEVLKKLKSLDPLPGGIFNQFDSIKRSTLLSHISHYIPEYIEYYFDSCLDYLSGVKKYPNGNPTVECKDAILNRKSENIIGKLKVDKIKKNF